MLSFLMHSWGLWLVFFIVVLGIYVWNSTITIDMYARRRKDDDYINIKLSKWNGLIKYSMRIGHMDIKNGLLHIKQRNKMSRMGNSDTKREHKELNIDSMLELYHKWADVLQAILDVNGKLRKLLNCIQITEWKWYTYVGTGDAMWTAMASGMTWTIKTTIYGLMSKLMQIKEQPVVKVEPVYQVAFFATEWSCIAKIKFGHAILAGIYMMPRIRSSRKGARTWQNILFKV